MRLKVKSSNIDSLDYDVNTQTLKVHFKNTKVYTYHRVPQLTYDNMIKAPSPTKFLNMHLHGKHKVTK